MRSFILLFSLLFFALDGQAVETKIHDIDFGSTPADQVLIFFSHGEVARLQPSELDLIEKLQKAMNKDAWVDVTFNSRGQLTEVREIIKFSATLHHSAKIKNLQSDDYVPSVLENYDQARNLFMEMNKNALQQSECWQRAHVWAYEWRMKHKLFTSKAWLFFTRKYLRENPDFGWWFHVAPMVHVKMDGVIKERVMDQKYSHGPMMIKRWAQSFMRNHDECRTVDSYSQHAQYQDSASCYIQKSSMYFLQPIDLELYEKFGTVRDSWVEAELITAYEQAFGIKVGTQNQGATHE